MLPSTTASKHLRDGFFMSAPVIVFIPWIYPLLCLSVPRCRLYFTNTKLWGLEKHYVKAIHMTDQVTEVIRQNLMPRLDKTTRFGQTHQGACRFTRAGWYFKQHSLSRHDVVAQCSQARHLLPFGCKVIETVRHARTIYRACCPKNIWKLNLTLSWMLNLLDVVRYIFFYPILTNFERWSWIGRSLFDEGGSKSLTGVYMAATRKTVHFRQCNASSATRIAFLASLKIRTKWIVLQNNQPFFSVGKRHCPFNRPPPSCDAHVANSKPTALAPFLKHAERCVVCMQHKLRLFLSVSLA